jgi:DNA-binding PadR family transcriptional regulator
MFIRQGVKKGGLLLADVDGKDGAHDYSEEYKKIEGKLLLLYLIDKMDIPLSNGQISQFALEEDYMDYFVLQQNLTEMTDSGFLDKFQDNNTTRYTILDKGIETLEYFEKRIPLEIRGKINKYVIDNRKTIKKDYEITSNYFYDHTNNEFIVKCGVYEDETMLMELNISVVSKEQAKTICANWKENVKTLYADILAALISKREDTR